MLLIYKSFHKETNSVSIKKTNRVLLFMILAVCLSALSWAEPVIQAPSEDKDSLIQFEQAVEAAKKNLGDLEKELAEEQRLIKEESSQHQIYRTQINSMRNFLLVPEIGIAVIEKGVEQLDISISLIKLKIQRLVEKEAKAKQDLSAVKEKTNLMDQRIAEFGSFTDKDIIREPGIKALKSYRTILQKQEKLIVDIADLRILEMKNSSELLKSFEEIRIILKKEIKDKKGMLLFQRNEIEVKTFLSKNFIKEIVNSVAKAGQLFSRERVSLKLSQLKEHITIGGVMMICGFLVFCFFVFKGLIFLRQKDGYKNIISKRTGYPLLVLENSLFLVLWILLAVILSKTQVYLVFPDCIKFIKTFLTVILITRLASDSIRLIVKEKAHLLFNALYGWRNAFVWGIRLYCFIYLFVYRFLSPDPVILSSIRIFSEAMMVAGVFLFWNAYKKMEGRTNGMGLKLLVGWSRIIALAGLFADISGYGYFASWWYKSWGISIMIICICTLLVYSMKDIDRKFKDKFEPVSRSSYGISYPFYWIFSNGLYFLIIVVALAGLMFSWSVSNVFFVRLWALFYQKYTIGKIELSMAGFAFAFVVILLTYLLTLSWKKIMTAYVLKDSGLSTGATESVITISVYVIWSIGILVSLSVFGLNTTSLAVVFGALSIGLGFGLQNIFNNFISGLILLFERPIQVGDVVEVGGIWGEVQKINVRSTLVQTYTNSSLIIPNSEFISALVTNWSHKDPYIRRDLMVGVAYGSDTNLVKKLLLQAAGSVSEVYNYPHPPKVQFINFGDSSLDFRLRFWSDIDKFIDAESNLRFEIDGLFKEHHVVIPFPQRDLHILSGLPSGNKEIIEDN